MSFAALVAGVDRAVLANLGGEAVTYQPTEMGVPVVAPVIIQGLFDETFALFTGEGEVVGPSVFLRLEDLPVHPRDDDPVLTIGGKEYRVRTWQHDGLGGIRLMLVTP